MGASPRAGVAASVSRAMKKCALSSATAALAYVYYEEEPGRQFVGRLIKLSKICGSGPGPKARNPGPKKGGAFAGDGRHGSIIPSPGRVRSRNDIGV
jgi:hypothetical protein